MREGWWINYSNGKTVEVEDHERWIRVEGNAEKIGVSTSTFRSVSGIGNRDQFLFQLMAKAPLMRVRGHGPYVTFEFATRSRQDAMDAIFSWGKHNAGPFTWMVINNLATRENAEMRFEDFETIMDEGGAEAVMRVAKIVKSVSK